jgi:hypothetical protein
MRLKIRCDGWKRKYFGCAWEVNRALIIPTGGPQIASTLILMTYIRKEDNPINFHNYQKHLDINPVDSNHHRK